MYRSALLALVLPTLIFAAGRSNGQIVTPDQGQIQNPVVNFGTPGSFANSGGANSGASRRPLNRIGIDRLLRGQPNPQGNVCEVNSVGGGLADVVCD
jgi:hypothetical protein